MIVRFHNFGTGLGYFNGIISFIYKNNGLKKNSYQDYKYPSKSTYYRHSYNYIVTADDYFWFEQSFKDDFLFNIYSYYDFILESSQNIIEQIDNNNMEINKFFHLDQLHFDWTRDTSPIDFFNWIELIDYENKLKEKLKAHIIQIVDELLKEIKEERINYSNCGGYCSFVYDYEETVGKGSHYERKNKSNKRNKLLKEKKLQMKIKRNKQTEYNKSKSKTKRNYDS